MATEIDYPKLTRQQRLAVFLIVIGADGAAEILKHFEDGDVESLCREMSTLTLIPETVQKQAIEEFSVIVAKSAGSSLGGISFAQKALEIAKGDYRAASIIGRVGPVGSSVEVIEEISLMEGRQIFNLIKNEQPQTISFLLSYMDVEKSSEVFQLLSPDLREDVIERLGTIETTSLELVGKIAKTLGKHYDSKTQPAFHRSGGVRAVADLLNSLDKETSKNLLARLEERNATLGESIRRKLFGFEDLIRLEVGDLQRILREVDPGHLAISMKSASEQLRAKFYASISKRAAESLKEELEMLGPVRLKDVEVAQDAIIKVVRRLEEEGQVTIGGDAGEGVVR